MKKTLLGSWLRMKREDFLGCSVALIVCIGNGRTTCLLGRVYTKVTKEVAVEAVVDKDLWIWHAFFGMVGSHNDINVLQ
jgi:hypothetical protein